MEMKAFDCMSISLA